MFASDIPATTSSRAAKCFRTAPTATFPSAAAFSNGVSSAAVLGERVEKGSFREPSKERARVAEGEVVGVAAKAAAAEFKASPRDESRNKVAAMVGDIIFEVGDETT